MPVSDLTIVVPTRNEAQNIIPFLNSLPPTVELIVVDAGDDALPDVVAHHRPVRSRVLRQPANVTQARQIGAELATTAWLLFTDTDIVFASGYFDRLPAATAVCDLLYGPKLSNGDFIRYYQWFARSAPLPCGGTHARRPVHRGFSAQGRWHRQYLALRFGPPGAARPR